MTFEALRVPFYVLSYPIAFYNLQMKKLAILLLFVNYVLSTFTVSSLSSYTAVQYTRFGTKLTFINATAIGGIPFDGCSIGSRERNEGKIVVVSEGTFRFKIVS